MSRMTIGTAPIAALALSSIATAGAPARHASTVAASTGEPAHSTDASDAAATQIRSVVETFRLAIIAKDEAALLTLPATDAISFLQSVDDRGIARTRARNPAASRMTASSYAAFVRAIASPGRMEEKFSHIVIHTDGIVGSLWFDYSFEEGGRVTNFGRETWSMIRTDRGWKIGSIVYSFTDAVDSGEAR